MYYNIVQMTHSESDPTISHTTDSEFLATDDLSFEELYANYFTDIRYRASQYRVRDPEATAQDTFVKAYEHYDAYKNIGYSRKTWLIRILHNTACTELRKSKIRAFDTPASESDMLHASRSSDLLALESFKNIELDEIMARIEQVISPKSPNWYEIFSKRVLDDDKYREIGEDLGIPEGTVKAAIFRACKLLADDEDICAALGN